MLTEVSLATEADTDALAARVARLLRPGDVVALTGPLGAGKTTFVRGVVRALCGPEEDVPSPTYTLVQHYEAKDFMLWHMDLYRLAAPEDVRELGWDDAAEGVMLIEWPDRAGSFLPKARLDLTLEISGEGRRLRLASTAPDWQNRLHDFSA